MFVFSMYICATETKFRCLKDVNKERYFDFQMESNSEEVADKEKRKWTIITYWGEANFKYEWRFEMLTQLSRGRICALVILLSVYLLAGVVILSTVTMQEQEGRARKQTHNREAGKSNRKKIAAWGTICCRKNPKVRFDSRDKGSQQTAKNAMVSAFAISERLEPTDDCSGVVSGQRKYLVTISPSASDGYGFAASKKILTHTRFISLPHFRRQYWIGVQRFQSLDQRVPRGMCR